MNPTDANSAPGPTAWKRALCARVVWQQAARYGLPVGVLQAALNQGDLWLHHQVTPLVAVKTVVSPLLSFGVALLAAAAAHREIATPSSARSSTASGLSN